LIRALSPFFFLLSGSVENPKGHRAESLSLDSEPKSVECGAWHEKIISTITCGMRSMAQKVWHRLMNPGKFSFTNAGKLCFNIFKRAVCFFGLTTR